MEENVGAFLALLREAQKLSTAGRFWIRRATRTDPLGPEPALFMPAEKTKRLIARIDIANALTFAEWAVNCAHVEGDVLSALTRAMSLLTTWLEQLSEVE